MIVAGTVLDLLVISIDVLANWLRSTEIKRSSLYETNLSRRNRCLIDRNIEISINLTDLIVDSGSRICYSLQREETVIGEVDDRLLVRCGHILDNKLVIVCECIYHRCADFSCITLFTVGAYKPEDNRTVVHLKCFPNLSVPSNLSAVQGIGSVVDGKLVFLTVQLEFTFANAVSIAADECGEVWFRTINDAFNCVVTLDNVCVVSVTVRYHNSN